MKLQTQGTELSIAILMDDLNSAKEISSALRNLDLFCHHYQSLDEFWAASHIQLPDLLIIDVSKMSLGEVQFKNHPKVKDGSLSYVFFSKDTNKVLLNSTLSLNPYGYLHLDSTLMKQVNCLVQKKQREMKNSNEMRELELRVQRLQSRSQRMIVEKNEAEEFKSKFDSIKNFVDMVKSNSVKTDFVTALTEQFENWEMISGYGFYELGHSGQKLVSPVLSKKKSHPFPALWLGQANRYGIEKFAEEMATQVARDLFESQPICLKLCRGTKNPELLVFISVSEALGENFPWALFEYMLSASYSQSQSEKNLDKSIDRMMPAWDALEFLDKIPLSAGESPELRVLGISFLPVCDLVRTRLKNKFYWSAYFNEFKMQLSQLLQKRTKISFLAPWEILIFVNKEDIELEYNVIQMIMKQIPVWKFFEDDSQVFTKEINPSLKLIPSSSSHYLRMFLKDMETINSSFESENILTNSKPFKTLGPQITK